MGRLVWSIRGSNFWYLTHSLDRVILFVNFGHVNSKLFSDVLYWRSHYLHTQENVFVHGKTNKNKNFDFSSSNLSFNEHIWDTDQPEQNRLHSLGRARRETDTFETWHDICRFKF